MSWRDSLRAASFRGVKFQVTSAKGKTGRRQALHVYPQRDEIYPEDMGKQSPEYSFDAYVIGLDYHDQRDKLIKALETEGPGELIHPYWGSKQVVAGPCDLSESTQQGGMAVFGLVFYPYTGNKYPKAKADTQLKSLASVADNFDTLRLDFNQVLNFALGAPELIASELTGLIPADIQSVLDIAATGPDFIGDNFIEHLVGQFDAMTLLPVSVRQAFKRFAPAKIRKPTELADEIETAFADVRLDKVEPLAQQIDQFQADQIVLPETTASARKLNAAKRSANTVIAGTLILTAMKKVIEQSPVPLSPESLESPFDSYQHAVTVRDQLALRLDSTLANQQYPQVSALQTAWREHLNEHGIFLRKVTYLKLPETVPALVLAHRINGHIDIASDIATRNRLPHSHFVPSGEVIEVLRDHNSDFEPDEITPFVIPEPEVTVYVSALATETFVRIATNDYKIMLI